MKIFWIVSVAVLASVFLLLGPASHLQAAGNGYTPGLEGVMGASVPPPGVHYRMYNAYVESDTLTDADGDELPIGFDLKVFAQAHRFVYITQTKLLGAEYGMSLIVPIISTDFSIKALGLEDAEIGLGDLFVEPLILSWHGQTYDAALAFGVNLPTGDFDQAEPASSGTGTTSYMMTLGGTYYLDADKAWSVSALSRTLFYGEQDQTDVTPGWEFIVDWGVGKQFPLSPGLLVRPGLCGYSYWQMGTDSGPGTDDDKGKNYAIGAEVNLFWLPPHLYQGNLRILKDFGTEDEAETTKVILTLTKSF